MTDEQKEQAKNAFLSLAKGFVKKHPEAARTVLTGAKQILGNEQIMHQAKLDQDKVGEIANAVDDLLEAAQPKRRVVKKTVKK